MGWLKQTFVGRGNVRVNPVYRRSVTHQLAMYAVGSIPRYTVDMGVITITEAGSGLWSRNSGPSRAGIPSRGRVLWSVQFCSAAHITAIIPYFWGLCVSPMMVLEWVSTPRLGRPPGPGGAR